MGSVILYKNFNVDDLMFGKTLKNKAGGNQVYITTKNNKFYLQLPSMYAPFGISEYNVEGSNIVKYSLDVSFKGYEEDAKIQTFMNVVKSIDECMIKTSVERSMEWFGKPMSDAVVRELYRPLWRESKNPEKYAPTFKMKIRTSIDQNNFIVNAYHNKEEVRMEELKPGSKIRSIIEFAPVWFVNKQFGITPCLTQLDIIEMPTNSLNGFSFEDDDDHSDN